MFSGETANKLARAATLAAEFTPEEFARLRALRERYRATEDCGEFGLDAWRLRYACWLLEHSLIGEGVEGA